MLGDVIVAAEEEVHLVFLQQWLHSEGSIGIWASGLVSERVCWGVYLIADSEVRWVNMCEGERVS